MSTIIAFGIRKFAEAALPAAAGCAAALVAGVGIGEAAKAVKTKMAEAEAKTEK